MKLLDKYYNRKVLDIHHERDTVKIKWMRNYLIIYFCILIFLGIVTSNSNVSITWFNVWLLTWFIIIPMIDYKINIMYRDKEKELSTYFYEESIDDVSIESFMMIFN